MTTVAEQENAELRRTIDALNEDRYALRRRVDALETERADAMKSAAMYSEDVDELEARLEDAQRDRDELVTVLNDPRQYSQVTSASYQAWVNARAAAMGKHRDPA